MNNNVKRELNLFLLMFGIFVISSIIVTSFWFLIKPDFIGEISRIEKDHFVLVHNIDDPESEYPTYTIFFNEKTRVSGNGKGISDLKEGLEVKVWGNKNEIASKIKIIN